MTDIHEYHFICFHGCGQTPNVFASLLKNTRRIFEKKYNCTFEFITGHHKLKGKGFSWYKGDYDCDYDKHQDIMSDLFFQIQSKRNVVLLGFSEGAMYVNEMALRYQADDDNPIIGVVSIAPPFSRNVASRVYDGRECTTPIVLVGSYLDKNTPFQKSQKWLPYFERSFIHTNDKGHRVHIPLGVRTDIMMIMNGVTFG